MTDSPAARPVWLTMNELSLPDTELAQLVDERFGEAPADATEAVAAWFEENFQGATESPAHVRMTARAVLAALGAP